MNVSTNLHSVKSVRVGRIESSKVARTGRVYFTRDVTVETEDGSRFSIALFSDDQDGLLIDQPASLNLTV